ncbi:MAG TPA: hypothetical protein VEY88_02390, partial [Archangium sp.]|nr:hypothetical protein [Archangium sp.]
MKKTHPTRLLWVLLTLVALSGLWYLFRPERLVIDDVIPISRRILVDDLTPIRRSIHVYYPFLRSPRQEEGRGARCEAN